MASATAVNAARFLADQNAPLCSLAVKDSFSLLTEKEKLYTHWVGAASWAGARIVQEQWTPDAQALYDFLILIFSASDKPSLGDLTELKSKAGLNDEEWTQLLEYVAQVRSIVTHVQTFKDSPTFWTQVFSNLVNYKSFGFTKFVPRVSEDKFAKVVAASAAAPKALPRWEKDGHISNYYPGPEVITDEEATKIQTFVEKIGLDIENTRVRKDSSTSFAILVASAEEKPAENIPRPLRMLISRLSTVITAPLCKKLSGHSKKRRNTQYGGRAEWEGFTAIVNKSLTAKYEVLVNRATELIKTLPWGKSFEVDVFRKPDFTALEVVSFATGGIPAGINVSTSGPRYNMLTHKTGRSLQSDSSESIEEPSSYYEVREQVGFKNVSLANILAAKAPNEVITFLSPEDAAFYKQWDTKAFDVQVANHELLGHGSGKLFTEDKDGKLNFDPEKTINPLTGKPVSTWYKPGQTAGSVLGVCSSSFEECRAECVGLYLTGNREILKIFGYTSEQDCQDIE
ncbi:hypothetical protein FRC09_015223, partial [Ceratobasidium sp. 395]